MLSTNLNYQSFNFYTMMIANDSSPHELFLLERANGLAQPPLYARLLAAKRWLSPCVAATTRCQNMCQRGGWRLKVTRAGPVSLLMSTARATWGAIPRRPRAGLRRLAQVLERVHRPRRGPGPGPARRCDAATALKVQHVTVAAVAPRGPSCPSRPRGGGRGARADHGEVHWIGQVTAGRGGRTLAQLIQRPPATRKQGRAVKPES